MALKPGLSTPQVQLIHKFLLCRKTNAPGTAAKLLQRDLQKEGENFPDAPELQKAVRKCTQCLARETGQQVKV